MGPIPFYRDRELQEGSRNGHFQKVIKNPRRPSKEEREREEIDVFYITLQYLKID